MTGARASLALDLEQRVRELRRLTELPIGVGFGISTPDQARTVAAFADAVVVGSALSQLIETHLASADLVDAVGGLCGAMKEAMLGARRAPRAAAPS